MKYIPLVVFIWLLNLAVINWVKIAVVNDIHYDPYYDPEVDPDIQWKEKRPFAESIFSLFDPVQISPFGHYGCDAPQRLVDLMLNKLSKVDPDTDIMIVSGDFISHGFSVPVGEPHNYEVLKQTLRYVFVDLISVHFPNTIILPAIGNNDVKHHYRAPPQFDEAEDYYTFLADVLFNKVSGNQALDTNLIMENFIYKGYFRFDYQNELKQEKISFLSFNSLYYTAKKPISEADIMDQQLKWLQDQFENSEDDRKFVLFFHVFPGEFQANEETHFWDEDSSQRFTDIIQKYEDKIAIILGAHTHFAEIRVNLDKNRKESPNLFLQPVEKSEAGLAFLITPSLTPGFFNNPAYTTFTLQNNEVRNIKMTFFELYNFPLSEEEAKFHTLDFTTELGIEKWTPGVVKEFIDRLESNWVYFYLYLAHKLGYRGILEIVAVSLYYRLEIINFHSSNIFFWASRYVLKHEYRDWLKK